MQSSNNQTDHKSEPTSNLQNLLIRLSSNIKFDPDALIEKAIPDAHKKKFLAIRGAASMMGFNPGMMIVQILDKFESFPTAFWVELESIIKGVIDGDKEAEQRLLELIGGGGK